MLNVAIRSSVGLVKETVIGLQHLFRGGWFFSVGIEDGFIFPVVVARRSGSREEGEGC